MINEARKTSTSFSWITPPLGVPSIKWLVGLITKGLIAEVRNQITPTGARAVLYARGWERKLQISSTVCAK